MNDGSETSTPRDLAGEAFWEDEWKRKNTLVKVNFKNYSQGRFDQLFSKYLSGTKGIRLIEIGCARSIWLPYFQMKFGCELFGLDYSETGCVLAEENLKRQNVKGIILCRNVFDDNKDLQESFGAVFSYGVVEHFDPLDSILRKFYGFCRPGGIVITVIPNMNGFTGRLQRWVNRNVYEKHLVITDGEFKAAHQRSGFVTMECHYMGSIATEVVNYPPHPGLELRVLRKILKKITKICWVGFRFFRVHPESKLFSPYIVYVGIKK